MLHHTTVIDADAYIGNFPFRKLFSNSPAALSQIADSNSIDKICVASLSAVFYRNAMDGNLELLSSLTDFKSTYPSSSVSFLPFAVINPHYTGFEKDIASCKDLGFYGIELCPLYHDYTLGDDESQKAAHIAASHNLPIRIRAGFEDTRQRHFLDVAEDISSKSVLDLITKESQAAYILNGFNPLEFSDALPTLQDKKVYFSTWKNDIYPGINDSFLQILKHIPTEQLVIGTNLPFAYPEPQFLRLENCECLSEEDQQNILGKNIDSLFS